ATSLAVATGALAYAWYQGNSTLSDFNKTLVLSGNQSGLTAMARQFHNVTAEQIAYVAQLQRSGDEAGALQAA
ncbi:phage tail length tape measure family protein, partial [Escherichia coli]